MRASDQSIELAMLQASWGVRIPRIEAVHPFHDLPNVFQSHRLAAIEVAYFVSMLLPERSGDPLRAEECWGVYPFAECAQVLRWIRRGDAAKSTGIVGDRHVAQNEARTAWGELA